MNEDFVTYEQAKRLKELGFDWKCFSYFLYQKEVEFGDAPKDYNFIVCNDHISAPTLAQATKWLRAKGIEVMSYYDYTTKTWIFEVCEIGNPHECGYHSDDFNLNKSTYEEAISVGIDVALEIYFKK